MSDLNVFPIAEPVAPSPLVFYKQFTKQDTSKTSHIFYPCNHEEATQRGQHRAHYNLSENLLQARLGHAISFACIHTSWTVPLIKSLKADNKSPQNVTTTFRTISAWFRYIVWHNGKQSVYAFMIFYPWWRAKTHISIHRDCFRYPNVPKNSASSNDYTKEPSTSPVPWLQPNPRMSYFWPITLLSNNMFVFSLDRLWPIEPVLLKLFIGVWSWNFLVIGTSIYLWRQRTNLERK